MIVLDTNVISELMKPLADAHVLDWLTQFEPGILTTTSVTVTEIEFGLQRMPDGRRKTQLYSHFETYLGVLPILPLDDVAARVAGRFWAMRRAGGLSAEPPDMMIAGIAAARGPYWRHAICGILKPCPFKSLIPGTRIDCRMP